MVPATIENAREAVGEGVIGTMGGRTYRLGRATPAQIDNVALIAAWQDEGATVMVLAAEDEVLAVLAVADTLRDEAATAVRTLHDEGVRTALLSGDNRRTAESVAAVAGIDEVQAPVRPAEKAAYIELCRAQGDCVAMVGDGINDAPALAAADIGIAVGTGTDVAVESADVVLLRNDLHGVVRMLRLSRATRRNIRQNLFWALIYNAVGIPLAAAGWLSPLVAGAAMAASSVSVVLNALRLYRTDSVR